MRIWWIFILIDDINDKKLASIEWMRILWKSNLYFDKEINMSHFWSFFFMKQVMIICWENIQMSYIYRREHFPSFAFFHIQLKDRLYVIQISYIIIFDFWVIDLDCKSIHVFCIDIVLTEVDDVEAGWVVSFYWMNMR